MALTSDIVPTDHQSIPGTLVWVLAFATASSLVIGCSAEAVTDPTSLAQTAPGADAAGALDDTTGCERLRAMTGDAGTCLISWSCLEGGSLSFICITDDAGGGCACVAQEMALDASTNQASACDDENALAAQARATCGWRVP